MKLKLETIGETGILTELIMKKENTQIITIMSNLKTSITIGLTAIEKQTSSVSL